LGGWTNPQTIDFFVQYADLLYKTFGDRVKIWITFYEPLVFCRLGYGLGQVAPNIKTDKNFGFYLCNHHVILAHAKTYHLYNEKYFAEQMGEVGINAHVEYAYKMFDNVTDEVVDRAMQFDVSFYLFLDSKQF
jgi:beta-glucosidase/6-phospho-beta-glucosidase/beta-galactosidase